MIDTDLDIEDIEKTPTFNPLMSSVSNHVSIRKSPYSDVFYQHTHIRLTIDSGATGNMGRVSTVTGLNGKVSYTNQSAHQAYGCSPLKVVGETTLYLTFFQRLTLLFYEGLLIENFDVDVFA